MTDAKEAYKKWIFEGNCPCCFPYWEYPGVRVDRTWRWADEFRAWDVYAEIQEEDEDG